MRKVLEIGLPPQAAPSFASIAGNQGNNAPKIVVTPPQQQFQPGLDGAGALGTGVGTGTRNRSRSASLKRKAEEENSEDGNGWRFQGRQRQRKPAAAGTSQVQVEGVGEYIAPAEFYIGNTDSRTSEETIKTVLTRCAAAVDGGDALVVEKVELLTKEKDPRTKCWKVAVPFRFKSIMEKDEVYPAGWKHRAFFGSRNSKDKKPRLDPRKSVEQQVLMEQQMEADRQLQQEQRVAMQKRLELLESRMRNPTAGNDVTA